MKKKTAQQFGKFAAKKSNAAIKEQFKQEKRKEKKEREDYFNKKKAEARAQRPGNNSGPIPPAAPVHNRPAVTGTMPLNKYIAHAGICGRREAAEMVKEGKVKVNNELVTEPGHKVSPTDEVKFNGKKIFLAKNLVYILAFPVGN